jgi:hypothetical protein
MFEDMHRMKRMNESQRAMEPKPESFMKLLPFPRHPHSSSSSSISRYYKVVLIEEEGGGGGEASHRN